MLFTHKIGKKWSATVSIWPSGWSIHFLTYHVLLDERTIIRPIRTSTARLTCSCATCFRAAAKGNDIRYSNDVRRTVIAKSDPRLGTRFSAKGARCSFEEMNLHRTLYAHSVCIRISYICALQFLLHSVHQTQSQATLWYARIVICKNVKFVWCLWTQLLYCMQCIPTQRSQKERQRCRTSDGSYFASLLLPLSCILLLFASLWWDTTSQKILLNLLAMIRICYAFPIRAP